MSFILDALKKSESERQRQSGPALFEVKVAPRRTRLPLWALALALLLAVNLAILAWMLLRHPAAHADAALDATHQPSGRPGAGQHRERTGARAASGQCPGERAPGSGGDCSTGECRERACAPGGTAQQQRGRTKS